MKDMGWKHTVITLLSIFVSVGIGTFICKVLERTEINVWLARGIGALITAVIFSACWYMISKAKRK